MRIAVACFALACAGCGVSGTVVADDLRLVTADDPTCQPDRLDLVRLSALGDFPTTDRTVTLYDPATAPRSIADFPFATEVLAADTETTIAGSTAAFSGARRLGTTDLMGQILILPVDRPCTLTDDRLALLSGQAVVALPDGGALFVGGLRDTAQDQVLRLDPGATTATLLASGDALAVPRAAATATLTSDWVVVAGGSVGATPGGALGTIELYDLARGRFDHEAAVGLALSRPRTHAGAGALPDGRVLVVGGIDEGGHPLGEAELVDLARHRVDGPAFLTGMTRNLIEPWAGTLDDGTFLVAGGDTVGLDAVQVPSGAIFVFGAADLAFAPYGDTVTFTPLDSATVVPLPGARLAYVGLRPGTGLLTVEVLYAGGTPYVDTVDLGTTPTLTHAVAAALPDGRILVGGAGETGNAVSYVVDLTHDSVAAATAKVRASALVPLVEGAVLELSADGASIRRPSSLGTFTNPGTLVLGGTPNGVALDDGAHWATTSGMLVGQANPGGESRLEVPTVRFGDARISLGASGDVTLILGSARVSPKRVQISDTSVRLAGCGTTAVTRAAGSDVTVERRGDALTISAGAETQTCGATFGGERFSVGISALPGAGVSNLRVERLAPVAH